MDDKTVNNDACTTNASQNSGQQSEYTFEKFKAENPTYLDKLKTHVTNLYNAYHLLHTMRFRKLEKIPEYCEIARKCGFGMLMRHALETISTSLALENGIEVGGRSVYERLTMLKGQNIPGYDREKKDVLFDLLDLTNEIAHPHIIHKYSLSYSDLKNFYDSSFKTVLMFHISYIEGLISRIGTLDFGVPKAVKSGRKQALKYLKKLKNQLDNFRLSNRETSVLAQGCLVRQLTECAANRWCYNFQIVPTDASTFENQIKLGDVLSTLAFISRTGKKNAFGVSALSYDTVNSLFELKNASNNLMHVEKFATGNLSELGRELSKLYTVVKHKCSPHALFSDLSDTESIGKHKEKKGFGLTLSGGKSPTIAALLCGTLGWTGIHHFYMNNIFKGIMYLLFGGFLIGPALDLYRILRGIFVSSRGVRLEKNRASKIISIVFLIIHLVVIYSAVKNFDADKFIGRLKEFNPAKHFAVEKIDESTLKDYTALDISDCTSTSHLETSGNRYTPWSLTDGNPSTCWQEGVEGNGEGESINFVFYGKKSVSAVSVISGKQTSDKAYTDNSRPEKLVLKIGNKSYTLTLEDTMDSQVFSLPSVIEAEAATVIIDSAYNGDKWQDLCISEITFYEPNAVQKE